MVDEPDFSTPNFGTVSQIIELLQPLSRDHREHVLRTVATWFNMELGHQHQLVPLPSALPAVQPLVAPFSSISGSDDKFANRAVASVKDFIFEKDPRTESERLACLAFYLTHYQDMPHFKNSDLTHINTEAAQRKLSNPSVAVGNAVRDGFFVSATKDGYKQLSAMGERFVHALPDREAAQQIRQRMASRRVKKTDNTTNSESSG